MPGGERARVAGGAWAARLALEMVVRPYSSSTFTGVVSWMPPTLVCGGWSHLEQQGQEGAQAVRRRRRRPAAGLAGGLLPCSRRPPGPGGAQSVLGKVCQRLDLHLATHSVRASNQADLHPPTAVGVG